MIWLAKLLYLTQIWRQTVPFQLFWTRAGLPKRTWPAPGHLPMVFVNFFSNLPQFPVLQNLPLTELILSILRTARTMSIVYSSASAKKQPLAASCRRLKWLFAVCNETANLVAGQCIDLNHVIDRWWSTRSHFWRLLRAKLTGWASALAWHCSWSNASKRLTLVSGERIAKSRAQ